MLSDNENIFEAEFHPGFDLSLFPVFLRKGSQYRLNFFSPGSTSVG